MEDLLEVHGMVISAMDLAEYDKRMVILTQERGKITVFARGVRRSNNKLGAAAQPFCMGTFSLMPGRDAYSLRGAAVQEYFREIAMDLYVAAYAAYFLEFASCYSHENTDGTQMLNLLYVSLKALLAGTQDRKMIRLAFEVRAMADNGEFPDPVSCSCCRKQLEKGIYLTGRGGIYCPDCAGTDQGILLDQAALELLNYMVHSRLTRLHAFSYTGPTEPLFTMMERHKRRYISGNFRALAVLDSLP